MTDKEKELWLSVQYPITIICDRYNGTYSGAKWLAFPLDYDKIPSGVDASDPECAQFWKDYKEPVGKGGCAEEAIDNLLLEMEPTESEDERIKRELKEFIHINADRGEEIKKRRVWIAWVEKQKGQTPVLTAKEAWKKMRLEVYVQASGNHHEPNCSDDSTRMFSLCDIDEIIEKIDDSIVEQKSVEWSEEDSIAWDEAFACVVRAEKAAKNEEELQNAVTAERWLKAIKFKYCVHSVKPDWSEEDIRIREGLLYMYMNELLVQTPIGIHARDIVRWLKSLRPQPKQKWSEEDEMMRNALINLLHLLYTQDSAQTLVGIEAGELRNWLKSLRPQWKPSKEQMKALKYAVDRLIMQYPGREIVLQSLYYDLRKL